MQSLNKSNSSSTVSHNIVCHPSHHTHSPSSSQSRHRRHKHKHRYPLPILSYSTHPFHSTVSPRRRAHSARPPSNKSGKGSPGGTSVLARLRAAKEKKEQEILLKKASSVCFVYYYLLFINFVFQFALNKTKQHK